MRVKLIKELSVKCPHCKQKFSISKVRVLIRSNLCKDNVSFSFLTSNSIDSIKNNLVSIIDEIKENLDDDLIFYDDCKKKNTHNIVISGKGKYRTFLINFPHYSSKEIIQEVIKILNKED